MRLLTRHRPGIDVLVHVCCGPDAAYGVPAMQELFRIEGFFFNPNIDSGEEHARRLAAVRRLQDALPFALRVGEGGREEWEAAVRGLEDEPEKGRRCEACVRLRLARTAQAAKAAGFAAFCTVLTVSPRKDAAMVNSIGRDEGAKAGIAFIEADMKKNDGFLKSVTISKRLSLYRQNYCGCRFSNGSS
ncbi:MAG: epoxyqueuosine reductase QueH [Gemmatimonadota bacterium]